MKIALVTPRFVPHLGGVENHVAEIAERCARKGAEITVFTQDLTTGLPPVSQIGSLQIERSPVAVPAAHLGVSPALLRLLRARAQEFDLIHAHSYHATPALLASLVTARRFVFTPHYHGTGHGPLRKLLHPPYRWFGKHAFYEADRVICVSQAESELVRSHFPDAAPKIRVIPNGIERIGVGITPMPVKGRMVLSVGRLERYKKVDLLIRAAATPRADFSVYIVGDGPDRARLERLSTDLGMGSQTKFLGRLSDEKLARWRATAGVVVSMSEHEAFGLTVSEALMSGARVVASRIPAHQEVLRSARQAGELLSLEASPAALAAAVMRQFALGRRRPDSVELPTWDEVADMTWDLYGGLIA